ncbi:hypothetical protein MXD63_33055 [Frankia sp. Cpl3]|nr:hypothetical protein [Frankia sp. Cpl3]
MATGDPPGLIEDILRDILGYTLGGGSTSPNTAPPPASGSSGGSTGGNPSTPPSGGLESGLRSDTVRSSGPPWLIPGERHEKYAVLDNKKPAFQEGGLTFWRWMDGYGSSNYEWLTVWVGKVGGSGGATRNSTTVPTQSENAVLKVGTAWTDLAAALPQLAGPERPFDPEYLQAVNLVLAAVGLWTKDMRTMMNADIDGIDTKKTDFQGSAARAFRDRVWEARRGVQDLPETAAKWVTPLDTAVTSARNFVRQLHWDSAYWRGDAAAADPARQPPGGEPAGVWVHPYNLIVAMFNGSTVFDTGHPENWNHSGGLWETGRIRGDKGLMANGIWGEMLIRFPAWTGITGDWPVLREPSWIQIDKLLRAAWADRIQKAFAPTVKAAATMITNFNTAAGAVRLGHMPRSRPPYQPPTDTGKSGPGTADLNKTLSTLNDNLNNGLKNLGGGIGDGLKGLNTNLGDGLKGLGGGIGDGLKGLNTNLGDGLKGLGGGISGFPGGPDGSGLGAEVLNEAVLSRRSPLDTPESGIGAASGLAGLGGLGPLGTSGSRTLGDLSPQQLTALGRTGQLDGRPLTPEQVEALRDAGFDTSGLGSLGDLTGEQLQTLQQQGLLDDLPLNGTDLGTLNDAGLLGSGFGTPHDLGDLSPAQLTQLLDSGQLDGTPLSGPQLDQLRQDGLVSAGMTGLDSLGDLNPAQLRSLSEAGLLDSLPVSPEQLATLRDAGLLSPDGGGLAGGLGDLRAGGGVTGGFGESVPSTMFPTAIDGVDVSPSALSLDPAAGGTSIGDIRAPLTQQVTSGVGGGFGTAGVAFPGAAGLGPLGTGAELAPAGAAGAGGAGGLATGASGGMPFMPMPMGGGMGGAGAGAGQSRERQRTTWLTEDEEVWGTDPECAPAVIGRDDGHGEGDANRRERVDAPASSPDRGDRIRRRR